MNILKSTIIASLALIIYASRPAEAQVLISRTFSGLNIAIPDNNLSGASNSQLISTPLYSISDITVNLTITGQTLGAFNGDFYAYLSHGSDIAILLNRPGRSTGNSLGYDDNGFSNVTFDDSAQNDIHNYRLTLNASPLTGTWQPDGRNNQGQGLDTDSRIKMLDQFNGLDPNGTWTLFVADLGAGATGAITSWGFEITAVPESASAALVSGCFLLALAGARILSRSRTGRLNHSI